VSQALGLAIGLQIAHEENSDVLKAQDERAQRTPAD
jgi:hypothetical protein